MELEVAGAISVSFPVANFSFRGAELLASIIGELKSIFPTRYFIS
jgi:hypothetical protein